mmetsp:Transcript_26728/g.62471  ORF Transcript_26728/g.62471 Transcript_26728/m.62471 type:complete len:217 (-) Transcript_26728:79-729(-)
MRLHDLGDGVLQGGGGGNGAVLGENGAADVVHGGKDDVRVDPVLAGEHQVFLGPELPAERSGAAGDGREIHGVGRAARRGRQERIRRSLCLDGLWFRCQRWRRKGVRGLHHGSGVRCRNEGHSSRRDEQHAATLGSRVLSLLHGRNRIGIRCSFGFDFDFDFGFGFGFDFVPMGMGLLFRRVRTERSLLMLMLMLFAVAVVPQDTIQGYVTIQGDN